MPDPVVVVAKYSDTFEAELARNFLESNGIPAQVSGDHAATLNFGALGGLAQLIVRQSDAERAAELLASYFEKEELEDDWKDRAEDDPDVWVCSLCGAAVSNELQSCDACNTPRDAIRIGDAISRRVPRGKPQPPGQEQGISKPAELTAATPAAAFGAGQLDLEMTESDPEIVAPDVRLYAGDAVASRAFLAAILGLFCGPASWYATFCLLRLALSSRLELSSSGQAQCYAALALVVLHFGLLLSFWHILLKSW